MNEGQTKEQAMKTMRVEVEDPKTGIRGVHLVDVPKSLTPNAKYLTAKAAEEAQGYLVIAVW